MVTNATNYDLVRLKNISTGEEIIINTDKKESRYRRICLGFLNKLKMESKFVKHIILTQKEENYRPTIIHSFMTRMKKVYPGSLYIWTVEEQERGVLHWHIIYAFDWEIDFTKEDVLRIQKFWKYGIVEVVPVRKRVNLNYLTKYITKALSNAELLSRHIKRIGTSRIEGWLKQGWQRVLRAIKWFLDAGYCELDDFYWRNGRAYVEYVNERGSYLVYKPPKEWEVVGYATSEWVDGLF